MNEETLFAQALGKKGDARAAFLDEYCKNDVELHKRLEALLRASDNPDPFLDAPAPVGGATMDEPIRERAGILIGAYKLLEQIGEGGFGVVFMAEQTQPVRRKVALKILKPGMDTGQVVARFEAERQALALMDHPNIARVFDGGETTSGRPYFVMELVRGVPITDFCDQNHLSVRERLELFVNVCQAVQHAHQKGIIHRDLKPTNVLVTMHDAEAVVKVIDFGIAKSMGQQLTEKTLFTNFAQMIGTPLYMSPEQAQMSGLDVDTRSDIYSLGVLIYELLTGTTPFDKERLRTAAYDEIRRIIREEEPAKPSTRMSTLGQAAANASANRRSDSKRLSALFRGELDWIAMKAIDKDRNRRYETANAFAADVQRYLNDEAVQACPPSVGYRLRKFVRRNKGPVLAATLVVLALLGGIIGTTWGMLRAHDAEADAVAEAKQKEKERDKAINESQRAARAELTSRKRLFDAKLAEVKASRRSREPGQRFETWNALKEAAELARELALDDEVFLTLRSEAVGCLALADIRSVKQWQGWPLGSSGAPAFDAELKHYARSDLTGNISVRRIGDDEEIAQLPGTGVANSGASSMLFSPDGRYLAVRYWKNVPGQTTNFQLWDWHRGKVLFQPSFPVYGSAFDFRPDGRYLALGQSNGVLTIHDTVTGKETHRMNAQSQPTHLTFSPDGTRIAVSFSSEVQVRDVAKGILICTLLHPARVDHVAWHSDGVLLGTGCDDGNVYLWDAVTGGQHAVLHGHTASGVRLAFAPGGDTLVSTAADGTSRLWDPWGRRELVRFSGGAVQFSRDGNRLVSRHGRNLTVWEVAHGLEYRTLPRSQDLGTEKIGFGDFSPDGRWLAMGLSKGIRLWDLAPGKEAAFIPMLPHMQDVKFHPNGKHLFTGGTSGLYDWPVRSGEGVLQIGPARKLPLNGTVEQLGLDRGGRILAAAGGGHDGGGWILDLSNPPGNVLPVSHGNAIAVATSPDGKWIATGTLNGFGVKVWDTQTAKSLAHLIPDERIATVAFSPDGRWLVSGTHNAVFIWATPQDERKLDDWQLHRQIPTNNQSDRTAFSADGKILAITLSPSLVQLLDPATGRSFVKLTAPDIDYQSLLCFSPDGSQLVTYTTAGAARVWNLRQIREQLQKIGLDWDLPAYPPPPPGAAMPLRVQVDLGALAPKFTEKLWKDLFLGKEKQHRFIETRHKGSLTAAKQKQTHPLETKTGTTYVLDLESAAFDTFLILEDDKGTTVAKNDDITASNLNSRIVFTAQTSGTYRIIAAAYTGGATGPYVLRIRELVEQK